MLGRRRPTSYEIGGPDACEDPLRRGKIAAVRSALGLSLLLGLVAACGGGELDVESPAGPAPGRPVKADPVDLPLRAATAVEKDEFWRGDRLFDETFHDVDGVGPLFIRRACGECHAAALKGPGTVRKMWVEGPDGLPAQDQSKLPFGHTERPFSTAGATPILAPDDPDVRVTVRVPPSTLGRGYLEAVADAEIEAQEAAQKLRDDGIHGRVHRVTYASETTADARFHDHQKGDAQLIGRFGLKARIATLDDFSADAYQGDMGITSPLRPTEPPNLDGLTDDGRPGLDVDVETVRGVAFYVRLTEIPARVPAPGRDLFDEARCSVCHVPSLRTRADHPIAALAGIDAPVFTDLLLHDLGEAMSDGAIDGDAGPREWRTAPLIGLRFFKSFLHDGRARSLREAIVAHGGEGSEARGAATIFAGWGAAKQEALLAYVGSL